MSPAGYWSHHTCWPGSPFMMLLGRCPSDAILAVFFNATFPIRAQRKAGYCDWNCRQQLPDFFLNVYHSSTESERQRRETSVTLKPNKPSGLKSGISYEICSNRYYQMWAEKMLETFKHVIGVLERFYLSLSFLQFLLSCFFWTYHWRIEEKVGNFALTIGRNCT